MPNKFYHIKLVSGKEIYLNPEHIIFVVWNNETEEWEVTVDNGFIFNFKPYAGLDNVSLAARFTSKIPM